MDTRAPKFAEAAQWGGGKYETEVHAVMGSSQAALAAVVILDGNRGNGFSVACADRSLLADLPGIFQRMADQLKAAKLTPDGEVPPEAQAVVAKDFSKPEGAPWTVISRSKPTPR